MSFTGLRRMFTSGGDDDFDIAEDFLHDAFQLNKKASSKNSLVPDAATLKNDNDCITRLRQIHEQRKDDIESLLEDDWDLDDGFLSTIHEVGKVPPSDENSTNDHDAVPSTSLYKDSIGPSQSISNKSQCQLTLNVTTPLRPNTAHPAIRNPSNFIGGTRTESVPSITNIRYNASAQVKQTPRTVNGVSVGKMRSVQVGSVSERGTPMCYSFNGDATDSEKSPLTSLPKRTQRVLGLEYRNNSSPEISPGYSSRAKRKFPGPAGILPQLPADGNVPKTVSPVASRQHSPIVHKDQSVPQSTTSSQSSQRPFQADAWQRMKKDFDIDDADPNSLLARFSIAWVLIKARAKELPKKKAPVLIAILKAIALDGRRAKVVLQDETGEIIGTIHEKVLEEYGTSLQPGTVLVLRQVSVFSPTSCKHYLNVTPSNIVALYCANGTTIGVQDISGPHLLATAEESLLEATMNVMSSSTPGHTNWARSSPVSSPALWSNNSPASRPSPKTFLFQPVCVPTGEGEDALWDEDDMDTLLQGLDEKDLCG